MSNRARDALPVDGLSGLVDTGKSSVRIVAEAAQGFEGDEGFARLLVRAASSAGADCVKFQLVYADELATPDYEHYKLFKSLEMSDASWRSVANKASDSNVALSFDVFGSRSLNLANELEAAAVKIHSSDFFNRELLDKALKTAQEVWLSMGGVTLDDVEALLGELDQAGRRRITALYGFQAEPTPTECNHLRRLGTLRERLGQLGVGIGFMDHSDGGEDESAWLSVLAVPFGVSLIEKHITLDRTLELEDHQSALSPEAFASFVKRVRAAELALGSPSTDLTNDERAYGERAIKSVVADCGLHKGHEIRPEDLRLLRTGADDRRRILEKDPRNLIGEVLRRKVKAGEPISREDLA